MYPPFTILVLLASFVTTSIFADTTKDIAICANKSTDAERLICYDDLAKSLNVEKPKTTITKGKDKWVVSEDISPVDDSKKVTLMLDAEELIRGSFNSYKPTMVLRCSENTTNAYVVMGVFLGSDRIKVLSRLDKQKATKRNWGISTDHKAIFAPGGNIKYIKNIMKHDKLLVQMTPYGANTVMTTFDIKGLKEAVKPLRDACH